MSAVGVGFHHETLLYEGEIGRYGLWLVHQLCDLVQQRPPARGGNVVRVSMRRDQVA